MNDQPPPGSEKKPRRRGPPRKRAPAKRAGKSAAAQPDAAGTEVAEAAAIDTQSASAPAKSALSASTSTDAPASDPEVVARRLDPAPLRDSGTSGDAPATDDPTLEPPPVAGTRPSAGAARSRSPRADRTAADAGSPAAALPVAVEAPSPVSVPQSLRQASLRPGELIRVPLSVRWRDLDAFNHVNNSKYLSYLEEARLRWMLTVPGMGLDEHVAPVVAASNLNYRRPIGWPGEVIIELFVERIGGSSLTIGHRIVDASEGGAVYCDGNVVMVWIDRESGRSAPLPEGVRAACR